jgi:hypothetical protein
MKKVTLLAVGLIVSAPLFAAPLNTAAVPADSKWVFHADFEAFYSSQLGQLLLRDVREEHQAKLDALKELLGSDLTRDLHSLTLFGPDDNEANAVAMVQGQFDRQKLLALLTLNPAYRESRYNDFTLYHWKDEKRDKNQVGVFAADNLILITQEEQALTAALEVLAGQRASLAKQPDLPLAALLQGTQGAVIAAAATDLSSLAKGNEHAAVLLNSQLISLVINEIEGNLCVFIQIDAKDVEAAQQIEQVARGLLAFAALQAQQNPDMASLVGACSLTRTNSGLTFEFRYPSAQLYALIKQHASVTAMENPN